MNTDRPTKTTVETVPAGQLQVSVVSSAQTFWDEGRRKQLTNTLQSLLSDLITQRQLTGCNSLRLVVAADDLETEIRWWQRELGLPERTSTNDLGVVGGKTLTWDGGNPSSYYGIVLIQERYANAILEDNPLAKALLAHEFAHIHDDFQHFQIFGREPEPRSWNTSWPLMAQIAWSEYFAESVASRYLPAENVLEGIGLSASYIQNATETIKSEIQSYKTHGDMARLWGITTSEIGQTINQIARVLGVLSPNLGGHPELLEMYLNLVGTVNTDWIAIVAQLNNKFRQLTDEGRWTHKRYKDFETILWQVFYMSGVYPYQDQIRVNF